MAEELRFPALQIRQGTTRHFFSFAVDGKQLDRFTTISRVGRINDAELIGYQRPEVSAHIAAIRRYIESEDPMIPNALVVAFDERVTFVPSEQSESPQNYASFGELVVPVYEEHEDVEPVGWIVDGQQRVAAIREAAIDAFPICVNAFTAATQAEQRSQFILVNSTKALSPSLVYELLPETDEHLPPHLARRQFPSQLVQRLNFDEDSPLRKLINTPTNPITKNGNGEILGRIKDNSVLRMLLSSLTDGSLYRFRDAKSGRGEIESMLRQLKAYWGAVAEVFPEAWVLPPTESRLTHGVGIISMGYVMDEVSPTGASDAELTLEDYATALKPLSKQCCWTDGQWDFGDGVSREWNELQNVSGDIALLSDHLRTLVASSSDEVGEDT